MRSQMIMVVLSLASFANAQDCKPVSFTDPGCFDCESPQDLIQALQANLKSEAKQEALTQAELKLHAMIPPELASGIAITTRGITALDGSRLQSGWWYTIRSAVVDQVIDETTVRLVGGTVVANLDTSSLTEARKLPTPVTARYNGELFFGDRESVHHFECRSASRELKNACCQSRRRALCHVQRRKHIEQRIDSLTEYSWWISPESGHTEYIRIRDVSDGKVTFDEYRAGCMRQRPLSHFANCSDWLAKTLSDHSGN